MPEIRLEGLTGFADAAAWGREQQSGAAGSEPHSVRVLVVIDTVTAAFEAEEILYELRDYVAGLVASPHGYLFSFIKLFSAAPECVLPDTRDITAATHCIDAYLRHLRGICERRGAVFETSDEPIRRVFADEHAIEPADLLQVPHGRITESGMRRNIELVLRYLLGGQEESRIEAEFARGQLWQWVRHETGVLDSGRIITADFFRGLLDEVEEILAGEFDRERLDAATQALFEMTTADEIADTLPREGYRTGA